MRLEISGLISDPRITGSVRFVESVRSEFLPIFPDVLQDFRVMSVFLTLLHKLTFQLVHLLDEFLTHRLTQGVGLTTSETCQLSRQKHHLFLINSYAVCIFKILLHDRNRIADRFLACLTSDECRDVIHRSRTIQGVHSDKIFKDSRLQLTQIFLHTGRFKLERTDSIAGAI